MKPCCFVFPNFPFDFKIWSFKIDFKKKTTLKSLVKIVRKIRGDYENPALLFDVVKQNEIYRNDDDLVLYFSKRKEV